VSQPTSATAPSTTVTTVTTIVSGLPRSGTSLMMQLLRAAGLAVLADESRPPDDSNPRGYLEYTPVRASRSDLSWLEDARGRAVKVVHVLLPALPEDRHYRVLLMRRPIGEIIASQNRMLERLGQSPTPMKDDRLAEIMEAQLEETRRFLAERTCFDWIEVDYPRLVAHPEAELPRILGFLELEASIETILPGIDPALHRERESTGR